jgi:hypothetical protein
MLLGIVMNISVCDILKIFLCWTLLWLSQNAPQFSWVNGIGTDNKFLGQSQRDRMLKSNHSTR